jgi:hypothetical protein
MIAVENQVFLVSRRSGETKADDLRYLERSADKRTELPDRIMAMSFVSIM